MLDVSVFNSTPTSFPEITINQASHFKLLHGETGLNIIGVKTSSYISYLGITPIASEDEAKNIFEDDDKAWTITENGTSIDIDLGLNYRLSTFKIRNSSPGIKKLKLCKVQNGVPEFCVDEKLEDDEDKKIIFTKLTRKLTLTVHIEGTKVELSTEVFGIF